MDNKEFSQKLEKRTISFAIRIIKLSSSLPNSPEARVIRNQVTKSASSVGANYREANRAKSSKDFKYKIKICEGEASETEYWLNIIEELNWGEEEELKRLIREASELLAIFTSISSKMNSK